MLTSVPRVVTVRPGQFRSEAVDQIEECPGQDYYVVNAAVQDYHLAGIAETCANIKGERTSMIPRCQRSLQFKLFKVFYNQDCLYELYPEVDPQASNSAKETNSLKRGRNCEKEQARPSC